jgi:hypothetical protein
MRGFIWPYCDGQFGAAFFGWADFFRHIGVKLPAIYSVYRPTADLNLVYPLEHFCILSERMAIASLRDGRLHSDDGPAVSYRDGIKVWSIGGVRVDEQVVLRPETQKIAQIDDEANAEVKRIRIERFGWERYLKAKKAVVIEQRRNDIEQTMETLMRCGDMTVLVGACPSTARVYALEVPSDVRTCEQAQNFLSGGRARRLIGAT